MVDIRKYLCDWELGDDFIERIDSFAVWRTNITDFENALFVMKNHDIYAAGDIIERCRNNANANNSTSANSSPKTGVYEPVLLALLNYKRIKKIIYGTNQVFICTEEGEVFGYGCCRNIGYMFPEYVYVLPWKICALKGLRVIDIAIGLGGKCVALCDDGKIISFEFGVQRTYLMDTSSVANVKPLNVVHVAWNDFISLLENGEVMHVHVKTLNLDKMDVCDCEVMSSDTADHGKIKKLIGGPSQALALDEHGCLFEITISHLTKGKLELCKSKHNSSFSEKIVDIAASYFSSLLAVLTESGKVYMWGKGRGAFISKPKLTPFRSLHEVFFHYSTPLVTYEMINVGELFLNKSMKNISLADAQIKHNSIIDTLKEKFDDPKFYDIVIKVESKTIPVHKSVIALRCEQFAKEFKEHWPDKEPSVLEIEDRNFVVCKAFFKYLYTDQLDDTLSFSDMIELLDLANKYNSEVLAERCLFLIKSDIAVENVLSLYVRVIAMNKTTKIKSILDQLKESCLKFIADNFMVIGGSNEFANLNAEMAKELIKEVCIANQRKK